MRAYAHQRSADTSRTDKAASGRLLRSLQTQERPGNQALQRLLSSSQSSQSKHAGNAASTSTHLHRDLDRTLAPAAGPISIQPKLAINKPGDAYEQEADRVAREVMGTSQPELQRSCSCAGECSDCQRKPDATALQTKQNTQGQGDGVAPPIVHDVVQSSGQALDAPSRNFMESRFGYDFSGVRIHADGKAAESAHAVGAKAYTVGQHIAFGENQYSPQTNEGRKVLAHELTHVVQQSGGSQSGAAIQRQTGGIKPAPSPGSHRLSVSISGCDQDPFNTEEVRQATEEAFEKVRDSDCIKNESLREDMLEQFSDMKIECKKGTGGCGSTSGIINQTVYIPETYRDISKCPAPLRAIILHEVVHLTERFVIPFAYHTNLGWDCAKSCFPSHDPRGNASQCAYESGFLPVFGAGAGISNTRGGSSTLYTRLYFGIENRRPIYSVWDQSYGVAVSFIGETDSGKPNQPPSAPSTLITLMGALRWDPGKIGGGYLSLSAGAGAAKSGSNWEPGAQVGAALGLKWYIFDVSANVGIDYDPTRGSGLKDMYTYGVTLKLSQKIRR